MPVSVSEFRESLRDAFNDAVLRHRPVVVERRDERAILLGLDDLERIAAAYEFHPEVFFEDGAVTFWLPELLLYGRGSSYEEAQDDLIDEVRAYLADYLEDSLSYATSPNRAAHLPHVVRGLAADVRGELREALFAPPRDEQAAPAAAQRAAAAV